MFLAKIALRNLSRQKRRSILLGGALSFGMFILVLVNGVTGGLVTSLQKNFSDMVAGHLFFLQLEKDEYDKVQTTIRDDSAFLAALEKSGLDIKSITRRTTVSGTVLFSGEAASRQISGVEWKEDNQLAKSLTMMAGTADGMSGSRGILISSTLAELIGLLPKKAVSYAERAVLRRDMKIAWREAGRGYDLEKAVKEEVKRIEEEREKKQRELAPSVIGEEVLVQLTTINNQQNVADFTVAGIFETQMDVSVYTDREVLNAYVGMEEGTYNLCGLILNEFSALEMKTAALHQLLKDSYNLVPLNKVTGRSANVILSDYEKNDFEGTVTIVTNLNNELGSFVNILTAVQAGSFGLFLVLIAVVMVGLVNTFRIVIYERTKEIGTMRALGTQRSQVRNLFLLEALFLALGGTIPGAVVGGISLSLLSLLNFETFTELAYFMDGGHLAYTVSAPLLAGSFLVVALFTVLAALIPARRAAKLQPAQALRTQF